MELRLLSEDDLGNVAELIRDPDTLRFTRVPEPPPDDFARDRYQRYAGRRGTERAFAVTPSTERAFGRG